MGRITPDNIPEVIWFTALAPEKILYVSPSFERIWGFPVEKLHANPRLWTETIHPDDRERVISTFSRWVAGEKVNYHDVEYRIVQPGGDTRWIHERGVLSLNEQGKAHLASGISTDVTERRQAAAALRASEKLARGQVEALKSALDALATESTPDRVVEHILRTLTEQFGAHSSSVWRRDEANGMIGLEFAFEDGGIVEKMTPDLLDWIFGCRWRIFGRGRKSFARARPA